MITNDMLRTVIRRRANGESVEDIRPDLIIPTRKRKGKNPSPASIYRALAERTKRQAHPEAIEQAHTDLAAHKDLGHGSDQRRTSFGFGLTKPDRATVPTTTSRITVKVEGRGSRGRPS